MGVEHQLAGAGLVIADQRPVVHTKTRVGQLQVVLGVGRQGFEVSAEVVAQIADQPSGKGQLHRGRHYRVT
ncbi:hypothetical protein D3C76_943300 [compost metagenome]